MGQFFSEESATEVVLERHAELEDERFKQIMDSVITHLHAVIKEVEPTQEEWGKAIDFLTRTGQICDDKRQEFILLSDTLGVSMLVDAINNRKKSGATESTVLGPFHVDGAPTLPMGSTISDSVSDQQVMIVSGRVTDTNGDPIANAVVDVWQTDAGGEYDIQNPDGPEMDFRGVFRTGEDGRYWFKTVRPVSYPIPDDGPVGKMLRSLGRHPYRPAHIHFILSAPSHVSLTTHIFMAGDTYLESDTVFGVKDSLIAEPRHVEDPTTSPHFEMSEPFELVEYDFVLLGANEGGQS